VGRRIKAKLRINKFNCRLLGTEKTPPDGVEKKEQIGKQKTGNP